ncbi:hypothetical protein DAPPUDRAFT_331551 [Daphnia pulex]|uniref:Uncharacterized protein n=1 Tax=Daphnia pulex TaxID=6669 RepID=E9HMT1_DAPPU|nr:hypothetical protein DAPPUDRAFT_331551 [Daphnia pulex]|eukprot:EFX66917.1 hypothetical protein DAPPUDRAFT_331551 [Daphnia pulex]
MPLQGNHMIPSLQANFAELGLKDKDIAWKLSQASMIDAFQRTTTFHEALNQKIKEANDI